MGMRTQSLPAHPNLLDTMRSVGCAAVELVWPTRCAVCDRPGDVVCDRCLDRLPFIDYWQACPRCGAPFGRLQCSECDSFCLHEAGVSQLEFDACVSSVLFSDSTSRICKLAKDGGEVRLYQVMGYCIACAIPNEWVRAIGACVTYIPAAVRAVRARGFDHGQMLAEQVASHLGIECVGLLDRPATKDQRALTRFQRFENMRDRFSVQVAASCRPVIVIDDVYTTGATVNAASKALKSAGMGPVWVATFAHVW